MPRRGLSDYFLLTAKVKDNTRATYMSAMDDFFDWCDYNDVRANTNHKLDWAFLDFMHDVYEANNGGGRAKVTQAMAGLQLFAPQLKGKLKLSAQALLGWKKRHPGK